MGELTSAEMVREHDRGKKRPQLKVAHVIGVSLGHIRTNPMHIMKHAGRPLSRALIVEFQQHSGD